MNKVINRIFSKKYVNHAAVAGNDLLLLMYRLAYPFAVLLNWLRFTPNQITTGSLVFAIFAFLALAYDEGLALFSIFWGITVLLDFCDGTVARMANKVSKSAFRYDHMSDIFKISLIVLGVGIRFDSMPIWILCCAMIFFFTYFEILAHDLKNAVEKNKHLNSLAQVAPEGAALPVRDANLLSRLAAGMRLSSLTKKILRNLYVVATSFNGHTLLIFLLMPVGGAVTASALLYLIALSIIGSMQCINSLRQMRR